MSEKKCISCGMPLVTDRDFALGDRTRDWCVHCADAAGDLKPYEEILSGMTTFLVRGHGLDEGAARESATRMLSDMPAWQARQP